LHGNARVVRAPGYIALMRTKLTITLLLAVLALLGVQTQISASAPVQRDRAYWLAIVENGYAVPAGASVFDLLREMNALLGSPDPDLRDRVAYSAAARWLYKDRLLTAPELRQLMTIWTDNLKTGMQSGPDAVLLRSFSALNLSLVAALDIEAPFMTQDEFDRLLREGQEYLLREADSRGYEPGKGWIHASAHTADLLKFLARNPKLPGSAQAGILAAISKKCSMAEGVFAWGEDERLAQVVRSIARRADFDSRALDGWLEEFPRAHAELWAKAPTIDSERFAAVQNAKLVLRSAYVALSLDRGRPATTASAVQALGATLARMQ
jgi:hypothetical protein